MTLEALFAALVLGCFIAGLAWCSGYQHGTEAVLKAWEDERRERP